MTLSMHSYDKTSIMPDEINCDGMQKKVSFSSYGCSLSLLCGRIPKPTASVDSSLHRLHSGEGLRESKQRYAFVWDCEPKVCMYACILVCIAPFIKLQSMFMAPHFEIKVLRPVLKAASQRAAFNDTGCWFDCLSPRKLKSRSPKFFDVRRTLLLGKARNTSEFSTR